MTEPTKPSGTSVRRGIKRQELVELICKKVHHRRKRKTHPYFSKQELFIILSYITIVEGRFTTPAAPTTPTEVDVAAYHRAREIERAALVKSGTRKKAKKKTPRKKTRYHGVARSLPRSSRIRGARGHVPFSGRGPGHWRLSL